MSHRKPGARSGLRSTVEEKGKKGAEGEQVSVCTVHFFRDSACPGRAFRGGPPGPVFSREGCAPCGLLRRVGGGGGSEEAGKEMRLMPCRGWTYFGAVSFRVLRVSEYSVYLAYADVLLHNRYRPAASISAVWKTPNI